MIDFTLSLSGLVYSTGHHALSNLVLGFVLLLSIGFVAAQQGAGGGQSPLSDLSSFLEGGLLLGLFTGGVKLLKDAMGGLLNKFFELDFVGDLLEKLGIDTEDAQSPFEKLKETVTKAFDTIKESLGLDDTFSEITTTNRNNTM